jgi:hypothetical protein
VGAFADVPVGRGSWGLPHGYPLPEVVDAGEGLVEGNEGGVVRRKRVLRGLRVHCGPLRFALRMQGLEECVAVTTAVARESPA